MSRLFSPVGCRCAFDGIRAREACGELEQAVASAVSTSQHPKQSVTLTSMPAIPVTPAIGKSWEDYREGTSSSAE